MVLTQTGESTKPQHHLLSGMAGDAGRRTNQTGKPARIKSQSPLATLLHARLHRRKAWQTGSLRNRLNQRGRHPSMDYFEKVSILTKETSVPTGGGEYFDKRNQCSNRGR